MKVLAPSIACLGRLAYPMHAKVTTHVLLGGKSHRLPYWKQWRWRATKVACKRRGLNITKWLQPRKFAPLRSRFSGYSRYADPKPLRGKADVAGEVTGESNLQTVVVGAQASREGLTKITSGRSRWQQGLVATCEDSSPEAKAEVEESHPGLAHESVGAKTEE